MFALISNIFGYLLNFLYEILNNNFGFAIIVFSILLRIILLPITIKQQQSMKKTTKIQGQIKALQLKYKNNQEMLNKETMELYKKENISPFSGCLSAIVQIIIIFSVFYLVSQPITYMKKINDKSNNPEVKELNQVVEQYKNDIKNDNNGKSRYIEIATIGRINEDYKNIDSKINSLENDKSEEELNNENAEKTENNSDNQEAENQEKQTESKEDLLKRKEQLKKLNINMEFLSLDLSKVPNENLKDYRVYIIPILYVISSFLSIKLNSNTTGKKKDKNGENKDSNEVDTAAQMNKTMLYIMPIMTVSIAFIAPLGLALYWFVSNVLMIGERVILQKILDNKEDEQNA